MSAGARVLVTGAAGHLGGHAARLLAASGMEVYGTTRRETSSGAAQLPEVNWLSCDLTIPEQVRAAVEASRPSLVLHTAGVAGESDMEELVEANVTALGNLVTALDGVPLERMLVVGSAAEYASSGEQEPIGEDHRLGPTSPYGLSKLFQFELSQMALEGRHARGVRAAVQPHRTWAVVRHGGRGHLQAARRPRCKGGGSGVLEVGDLDRWRDYVDGRDAAEACRLMLESAPPGSVFNVCSGVPVRLADVVDRLLSIAGGDVTLKQVEGRASLRYLVGDPSRLQALGWSPDSRPRRFTARWPACDSWTGSRAAEEARWLRAMREHRFVCMRRLILAAAVVALSGCGAALLWRAGGGRARSPLR